ncbi:MAG: aminoglycoside phosphotransferase, partial [Mesorhizobium sp.]
LPYVDFSTPALRLAACEKEVELNSRTAPGLYLGVRRITREAGGKLAFGGSGELVDAAIEMVRFDQSKLLDRMAVGGELTPAL